MTFYSLMRSSVHGRKHKLSFRNRRRKSKSWRGRSPLYRVRYNCISSLSLSHTQSISDHFKNITENVKPYEYAEIHAYSKVLAFFLFIIQVLLNDAVGNKSTALSHGS